MKYITILFFALMTLSACDNSNGNDKAPYNQYEDIDGDNTLRDDTIGMTEKDTLPVIVKKGEEIDN
ncbi:hypothetical protein [Portibacter marinus]|uniref:hypothetical protein n=1 Tax=Portibacter marinus TaxID=2898660 RepID=UPI001F48431B|nr:hypothetical protein [Portibacter marinus]